MRVLIVGNSGSGPKEEQDSMLPFLLDWVGKYYERGDSCSYANHRALFDAFQGNKKEVTANVPTACPRTPPSGH